jgi:hypothetical protein
MASSETTDQAWRGLYAVGGIMGVLTGLLGLASSRMGYLLYSAGYPDNPTAYLRLVSQKQLLANSLWSLWILNDLLGFAPSIAAYLVLRRSNRALALVGAVFVFFYLFYDISVTELNSLTLVSLSQGYASAPTDALRASYVTAATYGYAALPLQTVLSFGVGAIGWLLWSVVVLQGRSIFPRWMGVLGVIVNVIGIIGAAAPVIPASFTLGLFQFFAVPLTAVWVTVVGARLYRYGRTLPTSPANSSSTSVVRT